MADGPAPGDSSLCLESGPLFLLLELWVIVRVVLVSEEGCCE